MREPSRAARPTSCTRTGGDLRQRRSLMKWAFSFFEQLARAVIVQAWDDPERFRLHFEPAGALHFLRHLQSNPKKLVHRFLETLAGTPHFGIQFRNDVVIQGQRGSHVLMLSERHHDVYLVRRGDGICA